jgi:hypothetical protein
MKTIFTCIEYAELLLLLFIVVNVFYSIFCLQRFTRFQREYYLFLEVELQSNFLYTVLAMKRGQTSRSVSTKKLTISEYRRRLKDNVRSLSENLSRMVQAAKVCFFK